MVRRSCILSPLTHIPSPSCLRPKRSFIYDLGKRSFLKFLRDFSPCFSPCSLFFINRNCQRSRAAVYHPLNLFYRTSVSKEKTVSMNRKYIILVIVLTVKSTVKRFAISIRRIVMLARSHQGPAIQCMFTPLLLISFCMCFQLEAPVSRLSIATTHYS